MGTRISQLPPKGANLADTDLLMVSEETTDAYISKSITGAEIIASAQEGVQPTLVSGTNIKTVNETSLLGSGNVAVQPTLVSGTNIKTLEGQSLLGSGNIDLTKSDVGLSNVDNTSDANKPISTETQTALNAKQATLVSGTNIKTINDTSLLGSGNIAIQTNPRTLASVNGLNLTGTTNQISASVLIPAGTLVANNSIYIRNLMTKTAGSTTSTTRVYINTNNTLTGATLLGTGQNMTGANYFQRFERNFFFDGTNLNVFNTSTQTPHDLAISSMALVAFNPLVDNYLIFSVQNSTTTPDNLGHKRVIVQIYD